MTQHHNSFNYLFETKLFLFFCRIKKGSPSCHVTVRVISSVHRGLDGAFIVGITNLLKHHCSNYSTLVKYHVKQYKNSYHQTISGRKTSCLIQWKWPNAIIALITYHRNPWLCDWCWAGLFVKLLYSMGMAHREKIRTKKNHPQPPFVFFLPFL